MLHREPGGEQVRILAATPGADIAISAVNLCKVVTKLMRNGLDAELASAAVEEFREFVIPFSAELAIDAAKLYTVTKRYGLSLGDRVCLALAAERKAVAWSTDRAWKRVPIDVSIEILR